MVVALHFCIIYQNKPRPIQNLIVCSPMRKSHFWPGTINKICSTFRWKLIENWVRNSSHASSTHVLVVYYFMQRLNIIISGAHHLHFLQNIQKWFGVRKLKNSHSKPEKSLHLKRNENHHKGTCFIADHLRITFKYRSF